MNEQPVTSDIGPWALIPRWVLDALAETMTPAKAATRIMVYTAVAMRADRETGQAWPSHRRIGEDACGLGADAVASSLRDLRTIGAVSWVGRVDEHGDATTNCYTIHQARPAHQHGGGGSRTGRGGGSSAWGVGAHEQDELESCEPESIEPERATPLGSQLAIVDGSMQEAIDLCELLADGVAGWSGDKRPEIGKTWHRDMDRMLRLDGRDAAQVAKGIRWIFTSSNPDAMFWAVNVHSPIKLRKHWRTIVGQARARKAQETNPVGRRDDGLAAVRRRLNEVGEQR